MKKLIFALAAFACLNFAVFANPVLSEKGNSELLKFLQFRVDLTEHQKNKSEAEKLLKEYKDNTVFESFELQDQLVLESFYLCELYNYIWDNKENDSMLQNAFLYQIKKNENYIDNNSDKVTDWMYLITADCFSCYMSYNPVSGAMKYGIKVRKFYEKSIELNPENSLAYTRIAQWYYWAPGINGGSKKKALSNFEKAVQIAKSNSDMFYADIFYSQIMFDNGKKTEAAEYLKKAREIFPASEYVTELEEYNSKGYSLFAKDKKKSEEERGTDYN